MRFFLRASAVRTNAPSVLAAFPAPRLRTRSPSGFATPDQSFASLFASVALVASSRPVALIGQRVR